MTIYLPSFNGRPNNYLWNKKFSVSMGFKFLRILFLKYISPKIDKQKKQFIKNIVRHIMIVQNQEPAQLFYRKELVRNSGRFNLSVKFKNI